MILRVFPRRTSLTPDDQMAYIGYPQLWRPAADEVHISVTFTWDIDEGYRLMEAWRQYYPIVKMGGPAFDAQPNGFTPGLYVKHGVTFTTRGCNNRCPWCMVPGREGRLVEIPDFAPGYIIQDNNILQASMTHLERVGAMLHGQRRATVFSGGLDARLVDERRADWLRGLRIREAFLAADTVAALGPLERAIKRLGLPRDKCRVYVLIAFGDEDIETAEERLEAVWKLGGMPFAQLYQPADYWINYPQPWKALLQAQYQLWQATHKEARP